MKEERREEEKEEKQRKRKEEEEEEEEKKKRSKKRFSFKSSQEKVKKKKTNTKKKNKKKLPLISALLVGCVSCWTYWRRTRTRNPSGHHRLCTRQPQKAQRKVSDWIAMVLLDANI